MALPPIFFCLDGSQQHRMCYNVVPLYSCKQRCIKYLFPFLIFLYRELQGSRLRRYTALQSTRRAWFSRSHATAKAPVCCTTTMGFAFGFTRCRSSANWSPSGCTVWRCTSAYIGTAGTALRSYRRQRCRRSLWLPLASPTERPPNIVKLSARLEYKPKLHCFDFNK